MLVSLFAQLALEPVIVAAIVSALVALAILGFKEGYLEPRRTREKVERETLEKRVGVYGTILTMLQTFERRAKELSLPKPHLLGQHDEYPGLQRAIGRSRYLLSDKVTESWISAVAKFNFEYKTDIGGEIYLYVDLQELQDIVAEEYTELKRRYDAIVKSKADSESGVRVSPRPTNGNNSLRDGFSRSLGTVLLPANILILAICVASLGIIGFLLYSQYDSLRQFTLFYNYTAQYVFDVPNPDDEEERMRLGINLRERVFMEHHTMRVFALLQPSNNQTHPLNYTVILNGSQCDTADDNYERFRKDCTVTLDKKPDGNYSGNSLVTYPHSGSYYVSLANGDGSNPQQILNPKDDYIVIDSMITGNELQSTRLSLNVALLSGGIAVIIGLIAFIVPHVWRRQ